MPWGKVADCERLSEAYERVGAKPPPRLELQADRDHGEFQREACRVFSLKGDSGCTRLDR